MKLVGYVLALLLFGGLACVVVPVWLLGGLLSGGSRDEVARLPSPSGDIDAVLIETNGGATTSFGYAVYVVPHGTQVSKSSKVAALYGALRSERAYGVTLEWPSSEALSLQYFSARSSTLLQPCLWVDQSHTTVALAPGNSDSKAPPGGMLYNLQGRPGDR